MNWQQHLKLDPKLYNCWTFLEEVDQNFKVWNSRFQHISDTTSHKWGEHVSFQDIEKLAKDNNAIRVEITDLQPRDLLVFGINNVRPTHFGLYIGNNQFIHHRKNPKIDELNDEWRKRLKSIYR